MGIRGLEWPEGVAPVQVWPRVKRLSGVSVHVFVLGTERVGCSQAGGRQDILRLGTHARTPGTNHTCAPFPMLYFL